MLCLRRVAAATLPGLALISTSVPAAAAAAATTTPDYEAWTASGGWRTLPAAAVGAPIEAWRVELPDGVANAAAAGLVVAAEPEGDGTAVRAIDPVTGRDLWRTPIAVGGELQVVVDAEGETVLVAGTEPSGEANVSLLGADKGNELWTADGFAEVPAPQRFGSLVILATADGSVAVDSAGGAVQWRIPEQVTAYPDVLVFHAEATEAGSSGRFGVVDPAVGAVRWEHARPPGAIASAPSGLVILSVDEFGRQDSLLAFDAATGDQRWNATADAMGNSGAWPLGADGALFGGSPDPNVAGNLVALDASGTVAWERSYHKAGGLAMWRADGGQYVYTRAEDGTAEVIDASTGELSHSSDELPGSWPVVAAGALYYGGEADVTAVAIDSLQPAWTIPTEPSTWILGAVDGGFVLAQRLDGGRLALVGFLAR
jgi:outer membrane protein assembly factor BamB